MKDMMYERLILLATAQEKLIAVTDKLEQWDNSLLSMEKNAFEAINIADKVLNISKDGEKLVRLLREYCLGCSEAATSKEKLREAELLDSICKHFRDIRIALSESNELAHMVETETVTQKTLKDEMKNSLSVVEESLSSAIASTELVMTNMN